MPISESGTATLGMAVARTLRRKRNTTSTTSPMLMRRVRSTSTTEARMVVLRSSAMVTSMAGLIERVSSGISAFTRSITSMMLAPGCRRMITGIERRPSTQPAARWFSTSSLTRATSVRRTGAPLL